MNTILLFSYSSGGVVGGTKWNGNQQQQQHERQWIRMTPYYNSTTSKSYRCCTVSRRTKTTTAAAFFISSSVFSKLTDATSTGNSDQANYDRSFAAQSTTPALQQSSSSSSVLLSQPKNWFSTRRSMMTNDDTLFINGDDDSDCHCRSTLTSNNENWLPFRSKRKRITALQSTSYSTKTISSDGPTKDTSDEAVNERTNETSSSSSENFIDDDDDDDDSSSEPVTDWSQPSSFRGLFSQSYRMLSDTIDDQSLRLKEELRERVNQSYKRISDTIDHQSFRVKRQLRKRAGIMLSVSGFLSSSTKALLVNTTKQVEHSWIPLVTSFIDFIRASGIDTEVQSLINRRFLDNIIILARIQKEALRIVDSNNEEDDNRMELSATKRFRDPRDDAVVASFPNSFPTTIITKDDAIRYMKFATAAYGETMIRSAEIDRTGSFASILPSESLSLSSSTLSSLSSSPLSVLMTEDIDDDNDKAARRRIVDYCNLQSIDDIVQLDVDHASSNHTILRHFIALDHTKQQLIFAIRGTFSLSEFFVDVAAFSRPFCDGEAHSEMAKMAELLWEATEDLVLNTMAKHPSYELVFVGHSLGAGTASLLNVLYHFKYPKSKYAVRSVVFACPPVFTTTQSESENDNPMSASTSKAFTSCINFIHQNDCVPFLSVDSVRQLFKSIQVIENATLSWIERIKIITKYEKPYQELVQSVQYAQTPEQRVQPIPGAPILRIPAEYNVWLQEQDQQPPPWQQQQPTKQGPESTTALEHQQVQRIFYNSKVCDSQKLATLGLVLDLTMWDDHVPSQYELALSHLQEDDITI